MCGIFGYIGSDDPLKKCLKGLKQLEYRGYDSSGIAGISKNKIFLSKKSGKVSSLEKYLKKISKKRLDIAIAHTRWATHGVPCDKNAHPHLNTFSTLAIVHNGIIENYLSLKEMLSKKNFFFSSDTDTEVIANLVSYHYQSNILDATYKSLKMLKGSFAIALIHKNHPDTIIAASRECPLAIGYDDKKENILLASDPNAFLGHDLHILYLKKDELACISKKRIEIFDKDKNIIKKTTHFLKGKGKEPSKNGFEHFMLKEIHEQPLSIQRAMFGRLHKELGTSFFENFHFSKEYLLSLENILIIACGSSWHAGIIGSYFLEDKARITTKVEIASEIRSKNPILNNKTLVIAISQSGETADTLSAVRDAKAKGAKILAICNVKNSSLTREADAFFNLRAGPEISVCCTKAFTSQIVVLNLFALHLARLRNFTEKEGKQFLQELEKISYILENILSKKDQIEAIAKKYSKYKDFFFLGRNYMYPTALEAALKLKEISYLNANAYPGGELKHGPIALLHKNFPIIAFCCNETTYDKIISNLMECKARGAPILAIASKKSKELESAADDILYIPKTIDPLEPIGASLVGQLFAYYIAKEKNREIDRPRNLAKSVTVE